MYTNFIFDDHYRRLLVNLFGEMEENSLKQIFESGKKIELDSGEYLFKQGDKKNELYIVLSGRLRAINQEKTHISVLGDIAEGEPVGEIALFTGEPRMAGVVAIRKSVVLEINQDHYHSVVSKNPGFASALTRFVIKRMRRNELEKNVESAPKNIVLLPLQKDLKIGFWIEELKKHFASLYLPTQVLSEESDLGKSAKPIMEVLESFQGLNLLLCDGNDSEWTKKCLLNADLIILASDFHADPNLYPVEIEQNLYENSILNRKKYLLLLHPEDAGLPENTEKWFKNRNLSLHIHARKNNPRDIRRLCRIISNQAIGLVLGGSNSKGYAHIGAVKALLEAGLEIDFVGGSSAGAIYGMSMTFADFDFESIEKTCNDSASIESGINDFMLTYFSKNSYKKIEEFTKKTFQNSSLEDFWITSYCVSTDISNNEVKVHRTGPAWQKVQESFTSPGIFPPVVINDQIYVDGALSDKIPIDPMYRYPIKHIIAVSLTGTEPEKVDLHANPSVWDQIKEKFTKKKVYDNPVITTVMVNSMTLNPRQKAEINKSKVSLLLDINLRAVSLLDDSQWKKVVKKGHDQTKLFLKGLSEEEKFW
ncbi:cyclic nucleotide-binding and patatin-like phospholipase domain-containing protein [Shivajiella indica]|uniref:Cyclic nucleotide-binding and patatin-like phospholipase domain-containing protein n=1 Tax=Shivajiella indica TaxID=872115 RepID=A0ABW5B780_9BACT